MSTVKTVDEKEQRRRFPRRPLIRYSENMFGLLNINKPEGLTSRKVVDHVQRLVKPAKAGHAGTLDPLATGVLIVCVGSATRLISLVQEQRKVYRGKFRLGCQSDTDDITGKVVDVPGASEVSRTEIESALPRFLGEIEQVPPQFSAVHVEGKRAYKLARAGQSVSIAPKRVQIHRIDLLSYSWPVLELEIECGSGTYIRSIGRDLGQQLGCGAVMTELVRTRIGRFELADAVSLEELDAERLPSALLPARLAASDLPIYHASTDECQELKQGKRVSVGESDVPTTDERIAVLTESDELAAIAEFDRRTQELVPRQVFLR
jgi:tRNA pseudouridine55 synthase